MKSLRLYLITSILSAMILIIFLSTFHGYQNSTQAANAMLDQNLTELANMLSTNSSTITAYQVWQDDQLMSRSNNSPTTPITDFRTGFHDQNFNGYRWRIFADNPKAKIWVFTAERLDTRNKLVDQLITESVLPTLLILPVALIAIWLLVGAGIRPLTNLAQQVQQKKSSDLTPISLLNPMKEIKPLHKAINALLSRLQNALEREKRFSADAAHELRTPISILKIHLYNLKQNDANNDHVLQLENGIIRIEHLVEQILSLYRSSPDQYVSKFTPFDLYELSQNIIAQQYHMFEEKSQLIELNGDSTVYTGDVFTLEMMIMNLLSNASKYTPEHGKIEVTIKTQQAYITITVEDSGPGIPESQYDRVFDRFYRLADHQQNAATPGCGLGLSIISHIVDLHHGHITLGKSHFDSGLAITIFLPVTLEEPTLS